MRDNVLSLISLEKSFWRVFIPLFAALINAPVAGAEIPKASPRDSRVGELNYNRDQVFQIRVAKGIATQIVLAPDEKIIRSAPGSPADCRQESSDWCIVANVGADELFVQPRSTAVASNNLQLTTNRRRYSFDFMQSPAESGGPGAWHRVTFRYSADSSVGSAAGGAFGGKLCNWNYSMSRTHLATEFAPLAVFDDGISTYLLMPPDSPIPEMRGGAEGIRLQRAPGMTDNRLLVLAGIHEKFVIGSGSVSLAIWHERAGAPTPSGVCPAW